MHHIKCPKCHNPDRCNCTPKEVFSAFDSRYVVTGITDSLANVPKVLDTITKKDA